MLNLLLLFNVFLTDLLDDAQLLLLIAGEEEHR